MLRFISYIALMALLLANSWAARAGSLDVNVLRAAMLETERLLTESGVPVQGYAQTSLPTIENVEPDHLYLQGNDAAFVDGQIYLGAHVIEDCRRITLIHELVHDATQKYRLFAAVPNSRIREAVEALADHITQAAARDPYRPGCLPHRDFAFSVAQLAELAAPATAP